MKFVKAWLKSAYCACAVLAPCQMLVRLGHCTPQNYHRLTRKVLSEKD